MKPVNTKGRVGFTLTKEDFDWEYFPAGGNGGQKQNKTSSACRCTHRPSKSVGISRDQRSQPQNKKLAFERCTGTETFQKWCKLEMSRIETRELEKTAPQRLTPEQQVELEMAPHNLRIEAIIGGKAVEI